MLHCTYTCNAQPVDLWMWEPAIVCIQTQRMLLDLQDYRGFPVLANQCSENALLFYFVDPATKIINIF